MDLSGNIEFPTKKIFKIKVKIFLGLNFVKEFIFPRHV